MKLMDGKYKGLGKDGEKEKGVHEVILTWKLPHLSIRMDGLQIYKLNS